MNNHKDYFDKDYFESGRKTTATEMLKGRTNDPTAKAIAWLLNDVFRNDTRLANSSLEFGCGMGAVVRALRSLDWDASGFDISDYASQSKGVSQHDATDPWPYLTESFDLVYSIEVLEHIYAVDICQVYEEAYRVLKPDGYLVCSIATKDDLKRVERILEKHPEQRDESHVTCATQEWWIEMAKIAKMAKLIPCHSTAYRAMTTLVPMECSPYSNSIDKSSDWDPLDDSPFKLYGKFQWSLFVFRKEV